MNIVKSPSIPYINNRSNFLISKVPKLHPSSIGYLKYWKTHKKRCIEGFWGIDDENVNIDIDDEVDNTTESSQWRYMPGNLYFYVNFGTILHQDEKGPRSAPKMKMRPYLRDIEWGFFYNWLESRGFSGFNGDKEFTCDKRVIQLDQESLPEHLKGLKYVETGEYIRMLRSKPLGLPLYDNQASNLFMLGARGFGKSFMVGVGVVLHELLFDGAKEYSKRSMEHPYKAEIFVGAAISSKSADILSKTKEAMEHLPGDYIDSNGRYYPSPLTKSMAGGLGPNNMKNPWRHEYDKNVGGTWIKLGTGSNIKHGIYTTENPEAAAGTRPGVMVIEEVGLMSNVLTAHGSNVACQMEGNWKFGSSVYLGTGGNMEKIIESEVIFRDPRAFQFLEFEDVWEGTGKIGWFVPAVYGINSFKDKNGNTRFGDAYEYKLDERSKAKKAKSSSALDLEMMNYPLVPSEMFLNKTGNRFPIADLKEQLKTVEQNNKEYSNKHWYGDLTFNSKGKLNFTPKDKKEVVHSYPILDNSIHPGIIEFFEMPKEDKNDEVFANRYFAGTDTYDDDDSTTNSLGSCIIMDGWTKRIVAEYTGRRNTREFYEITRKLTMYYNALNNYENNKKGLFWHYEKKKSLNRLADTPESLKDEANTTIRRSGNTRKGTPATVGVNSYALQLIEMWLDNDDIDDEEGITPVQLLRSPGIIRELIAYNPDGNFDRISALGMLLILVEDRYKTIRSSKEESIKPSSSNLANDSFFTKNYDYKNFSAYNPNKKIHYTN
mgnify:CR=1 FL=1|tara:strand:+ start:10754 stop:13066 length:2313 start_codon:yes stop_codon:yes gene_type:complete